MNKMIFFALVTLFSTMVLAAPVKKNAPILPGPNILYSGYWIDISMDELADPKGWMQAIEAITNVDSKICYPSASIKSANQWTHQNKSNVRFRVTISYSKCTLSQRKAADREIEDGWENKELHHMRMPGPRPGIRGQG